MNSTADGLVVGRGRLTFPAMPPPYSRAVRPGSSRPDGREATISSFRIAAGRKPESTFRSDALKETPMARPDRSAHVAAGLLPRGDYQAAVVESAVVPTASGGGEMLKLTFEVTAGALRRRRVVARLNIVNANATAQRIAQQMLSRLCIAAGLAGIADSEELHGIAVTIRVDIRPGSGDYGEQNVIKDYRPPAVSARVERPASGRRPWDS